MRDKSEGNICLVPGLRLGFASLQPFPTWEGAGVDLWLIAARLCLSGHLFAWCPVTISSLVAKGSPVFLLLTRSL